MTELEIAPTTIRCCECHLNLPLSLFTHSDAVCDFCRRKRVPNPTGKEWEDMGTISRINDMFLRQGKRVR